jgi:hypothetical protein
MNDHIEANTASGNTTTNASFNGGITVLNGNHNIVIRNTASSNGVTDFNITGKNAVGDILTVYNGSSAVTITSSNPWANFTY